MTKDRYLQKIVELEWNMFSRVQNAGGPAACQNDPATFRIMRTSQCAGWPEKLLASYLADLETAQAAGRNLLTEKYAWMMRSTCPEEFAALEKSLPKVEDAVMSQIDSIVAVNIAWQEDIARRYPCLAAHGRPLRSSADSRCVTSVETYLRSELMTWSPKTIAMYREYTMNKRDSGGNDAEDNLRSQMLQYGFSSLDDAECRLVSSAGG